MDLNLYVTEKQALMLKYRRDDITTEIGYGGAAGGAKSRIGTTAVRESAMEFPGSRWLIGRKELVNLKRTTLQTYYKMLAFYGVPEHYRGKLNGQTNEIIFPNGSIIYLMDCADSPSDPEFTKFGSLELTGAFVDEANEVSSKCLQAIKSRIGRQNDFVIDGKRIHKTPKLLQTFNPNKGHVYDDFYRPRKDGTLPEYRAFIPALVGDNPYLSPDYIKQLERADEITKQRLLYGNFEYDDTPGKLFRWDEISDLFVCNIEKDDTTYISCDVARLGEDNTVIYVWKGLEAVEIISYNGKTTDQTVEIIRELEQRYNVRRCNIVIDGDGIGGGVIDHLRGCVSFLNNGTPLIQKDEVKNYANLKTQCYFKLKYLMEKRAVRVNASGEIKDRLQRELDNILLKDVDGEGKVRLEAKEDMKKRLSGNSPDYADALMMRMYFTLGKSESPIEYTDIITVSFDDYLY